MKFLPKALAISALALMTAAAQAADIKIAMNGADDTATNPEAAFAHGFADALKGTEFEVSIFPSGTLARKKSVSTKLPRDFWRSISPPFPPGSACRH